MPVNCAELSASSVLHCELFWDDGPNFFFFFLVLFFLSPYSRSPPFVCLFVRCQMCDVESPCSGTQLELNGSIHTESTIRQQQHVMVGEASVVSFSMNYMV